MYPLSPLSNPNIRLSNMIPNHRYKNEMRETMIICYTSFGNLGRYKTLSGLQRICTDVISYPINSFPICGAQLLKQVIFLSESCHITLK